MRKADRKMLEYLSDANKLREVREYINARQPTWNDQVYHGHVLMDILCIIKYGEGFEMEDLYATHQHKKPKVTIESRKPGIFKRFIKFLIGI